MGIVSFSFVIFLRVPPWWYKQVVLCPDSVLLVLMRLRLNFYIEGLLYQFGVLSTVHDVFQKLLEVIFVHLKFFIKWPIVLTYMPQIFKNLYS